MDADDGTERMARFGADRPQVGRLEVQEDRDTGLAVALLMPNESALKDAGMSPDRAPVKVFELNRSASTISVFPINTLPFSERFLEPKYGQIERIDFRMPELQELEDVDVWEGSDGRLEINENVVEAVLRALPRGFTKDFQFGLGMPKEYQVIVRTIEDHTDCNVLRVGLSDHTRIDGSVFEITDEDFEDLRAELDRISNRGNQATARVKKAKTANALAVVLGIDLVPIARGRHPITQAISDEVSGTLALSEEEQDGVVQLVKRESKRLFAERPEVLASLRDDIELVSLEALVESFGRALTANHAEHYWQSFFKENPFALHLVFGFPVVQIQGQASIGGRRFSGTGEKITDFLVENPLSHNVGIFEIKTPATKLLRSRAYRDGIYGPSTELSGSMSQLLDQRFHLQAEFLGLKENTNLPNLKAYSVRCCLIIGSLPRELDEVKSFELLRSNSRDVEIVTYDELLRKLVQLRDLLKQSDAPE